MKKRLLTMLLAAVMTVSFAGCLDMSSNNDGSSSSVESVSQAESKSENKKAGQIESPLSAKDCKNKNYNDIKEKFESAGFTNVETKPLGDMIVGILSTENEVKRVEIDGTSSFDKGDSFDKSAKVVISYHSYPEKEEKTTTKEEVTTQKERKITTERTTTTTKVTQPSVSMEYQNALKSAKSYLEFSAFSRKGLIEQLEFEQYSNAAATYAVDNCGANWNEQAVKCAKSYLEFSSFSKKELIEQLEFEGFTKAQAQYGVNAVYK